MNATKTAASKANRKVLVTYAWVRSSWAIIRNLARHGLSVYAGDHQNVFMSRYSRYCQGWFRYPHFRDDPIAFVESLADFISKNDIGTYLPSHEEGFIVARHRDRFPSTVQIPISPSATIDRLNDKGLAQKLAEELSVPHPATHAFSSKEEFHDRAGEMPARGVIKHIDSHGSHGVSFYETPDELVSHWLRMAEALPEGAGLPIVQEYLEGRIYACSLLAREGETVAHFVRRNLREKEIFGGAAVKCESVHYPELVEYSERIAAAVSYTGAAMFEFLVDERTNRASLMEINPRYWGTTPHDIDCGIDYPYFHYCIANDIPFAPKPDYEDGIVGRWIAGDVISWKKHRLANLRSSITGIELLGMDRSHKMDFKLDDPLPFLVQSYLYFKFRRQIFD